MRPDSEVASEIAPPVPAAAQPDPRFQHGCRVESITRETPDTFTLVVTPDTLTQCNGEEAHRFAPGQFSMIYVYGIGELPISISGDPYRPGRLVYTVRSVGLATKQLVSLRPGDWLGVRGIALAGEQGGGFGERQADDRGVGADQAHHESAGEALDRVAPRFAAPFSRGEIGVDFLARQALEADARLHQPLAGRPARRDQRHRGVDAMRAPREKPQASGGLIRDFAFGQHAAPHADDRVGGDDEAAPEPGALQRHSGGDRRFFRGEALRKRARRLAAARRFVDVGGNHRIGVEAHLREQGKTPWRGGRQHQRGA